MRIGALLSTVVLFISCSKELPAENLSELGFYSSPEKVVAALEGKAQGPAGYFMLGQACRETKDYRKAVIYFANSCFRFHTDVTIKHFPLPVYRFVTGYHFKSKYFPDAAYELARLYVMYQEHKYAVKFADLVPEDGSILYRDAMLLKAQSLVTLKQSGEALSCLSDLLDDYRDAGSASLIHIRIASLLEQEGKTGDALAEYGKAVYPDSDSWQAVLASKKAVEIMKTTAGSFTAEEKVSLAEALYRGKKYDEALELLNSINSREGGAGVILVKCLARKNESARLAALVETKGFSPQLIKVYADELWSMGRKAQAVKQYEAVYATGAEPAAMESMERVARYMEDRKTAGFEGMLLKFAEKYGNHEKSADFLWLLGRRRIEENRKDEAEKYLSTAVERFPDFNNSGNCRFWLYKLKAERGDSEGALKAAADMAVHNPDSSYAWRLFTQLAASFTEKDIADRFDKARDDDDNAGAMLYHTLLFIKEKDLSKRTGRIAGIGYPLTDKYRAYAKAFTSLDFSSGIANKMKSLEKYFEAGYLPGINREMQAVSDDKEDRKDMYRAFVYFGTKYGYNHLKVYGAIALLKLYGLKENIAVLPEDAVEGVLPRPFGQCVKESGKRYKVKESLIYAVIKAESLFNHKALSSAGAVGLMQLMPGTAKGIAKELSIDKDFDLNDPCTSVLFGTHYISWLQGYLEGNFEYMVAGYNGGAGNVKKWKKELNAPDLDYFTEFVPYDETRFYILRTGKFLTQYRSVYGEE